MENTTYSGVANALRRSEKHALAERNQHGAPAVDKGETLVQAEDAGSQPLKALGLVWIHGPYSVMSAGLEQALEAQAWVHVGVEAPKGIPSCIILCADGVESLSESVNRAQNINPNAAILVFGVHADIASARAAFHVGAQGYVHAGMTPNQVARAVMVAANGEPVAPRELLRQLITREDPVDLNILSIRQQEILQLVVDGLSNAEIARRVYLSESTIKQHLRAAYKLLGVNNRMQAARLVRSGR